MDAQHTLSFPNESGCYGKLNEPGTCPLCKHSIKPEVLCIHPFFDEAHKRYAAALFLCRNCFRSFSSLYSVTTHKVPNSTRTDYTSQLLYTGPSLYKEKEFDTPISDLSPQFVKIFNQAAAAEDQGLDEIAGIGYRKAIEFLVKDFSIHLHPEDPEAIKRKPLARCIDEYIDNPQIKLLASRAVWIGNDETHYVRKQEDRDIEDMKKFINAMVYFVGMCLIAEDAASMSPA